MTHPRYENLCPTGARIQSDITRDTAETRRTVRLLTEAEDHWYSEIPHYRDQLTRIKTQVANHRIKLSRHAAHCTDGCKHIPDPTFPTRVTGWDRAPSHSKPEVPPAGELAAMIAAGQTIDAIADIYQRHPGTLRVRLTLAGYSATTGRPVRPPSPRRDNDTQEHPDDTGVLEAPPWADDALCAQTDPEAFYPEQGGSSRDAKRVCLACPLRDDCLTYALAHGERHGIWGGLTAHERRRLTRTPAPATSTPAGAGQTPTTPTTTAVDQPGDTAA